jgi:hypothetical protein
MGKLNIPRKRVIGSLEIFLLVIIVLNILDFFQFIGSELDYVKKLLSWTILGVLLIRVSPSKVLFGRKHPDIDSLLLFSYYLLILKNMLLYAHIAMQSAGVHTIFGFSFSLIPFYTTLLGAAASFEFWTFTTGVVCLLFLSVYVSLRVPFATTSVMGVLHEQGTPSTRYFFSRFISTLLVFFSFFLFVFNLMMEWLAIAVDAALLVIALFLYSFLLVRHRVVAQEFVVKVGNVGSDFIRSFIDHFRYRNTLLLGIAGLLVLHLLTDIGIFLIPFITGLAHPLYSEVASSGFLSVWGSLSSSLQGGFVNRLAIIIVFCANIAGFLLLFLSPSIAWLAAYRRRSLTVSRWFLRTFFVSLPAIIISPLFGVRELQAPGVAGVELIVLPLHHAEYAVVFMFVFACVVEVFIRHKSLIMLITSWLWISTAFFAHYIMSYFLDVFTSYQALMFSLLAQRSFFIASTLFVFASLTILFYVGGFVALMYSFRKFLYSSAHKKRS